MMNKDVGVKGQSWSLRVSLRKSHDREFLLILLPQLLRYRWSIEAAALKGDVTSPFRRSLRSLLFKFGSQTADEAGYWDVMAEKLLAKYPDQADVFGPMGNRGELLREIWVSSEEPRICNTRPFAWLDFDELLA